MKSMPYHKFLQRPGAWIASAIHCQIIEVTGDGGPMAYILSPGVYDALRDATKFRESFELKIAPTLDVEA